jgi:hypothetical protein
MNQACKKDIHQHLFIPMVSSLGLELQNHWFEFGMLNLRFVFSSFIFMLLAASTSVVLGMVGCLCTKEMGFLLTCNMGIFF